MIYTYNLLQHAQNDYEQSLQWYGEKSFDAAKGFVKAINNGLQLIYSNLYRWRNKYKTFMKLP